MVRSEQIQDIHIQKQLDKVFERIKNTTWSYIIEEDLLPRVKFKLHELGYTVSVAEDPTKTIIRGWK